MEETTPKTIAELLKQARTAKSLTLETIGDRLKLTSEQLAFFEEPNLNLQALDPFQRGYLRNYAELLEVDISPFESEFPEGKTISSNLSSVEKTDGAPPPLMSTAMLKGVSVILILVLIAALILINQ